MGIGDFKFADLFKNNKEETQITSTLDVKNIVHMIRVCYNNDSIEHFSATKRGAFKDLLWWYENSNRRYYKFIYKQGILMLDRENITKIKILFDVEE